MIQRMDDGADRAEGRAGGTPPGDRTADRAVEPADDHSRSRARHRGEGGANLRRRWVWGGAAVAAALTTALTVQYATGSACAAAVAPPAARADGKATFYDLGSGTGNCSFPGTPADDLYVALGPAEYDAAAACGGYLDVTGPRGSVRVKVIDQCPECERGHVDLSRTAFARIADPVQGIVDVTYRTVTDPGAAGRLSFRVKEGSSQFWLALLVLDHGNPLRSVEVRRGGDWVRMQRADYNYWLAESGAGSGPFTVRVTDVEGHRATADGIRLAPGDVQRSDARLYGAGASGDRAPADRSTSRTERGASRSKAAEAKKNPATAQGSRSASPTGTKAAARPPAGATAAAPGSASAPVRRTTDPVAGDVTADPERC